MGNCTANSFDLYKSCKYDFSNFGIYRQFSEHQLFEPEVVLKFSHLRNSKRLPVVQEACLFFDHFLLDALFANLFYYSF